MIMRLRWLLLALATAAGAEERPAPVEPWQVRGELQIIRLDAQRAIPIIARFTDDAPGAAEELRHLLADGTATLVAHLIGRTTNGDACEAEQTRGMRYGTEFLPFDRGLIPEKQSGKIQESVHFPITAFERMDIGATLRFEPFVHKGGSIVSVLMDLNLRDDAKFQRLESGIQDNGTRLGVDLPTDFVRRNASTFVVHAGVPTLIGCCKPEGQRAILELQVLTIHVRLLDGPLPKAKKRLDPPNAFAPRVPDLGAPAFQTRIELHRFLMPEADALRLRPALLDLTKIDSAFANLLDSVKSGSCELAGILSIPLRDDRHGEFENGRGQRYMTEPSPGSRPQTIGDAPDIQEPKPRSPVSAGKEAAWSNPVQYFERRDVGDHFEAETKVHPQGELLELQLSYSIIGHRGFMRWPTGAYPPSRTAHSYGYQPDFTLRKSNITLSLANRQRTLLHFQKLPAPDGRVEIALIRTITERFNPDAKP